MAYCVELTAFSFPSTLEDKRANFRLQVDLRYREPDGDFAMKTVVMPGLDVYWECSLEKNKNHDRDDGAILIRKKKNRRTWMPEADMDSADLWNKLFRVNADELYELRVTVFDVNRKDWWDKFTDVFKKLGSIVSKVAGPFGTIMEEAASSVGKHLADGGDRVLFRGSTKYTGGSWMISHGDYSLSLTATEI